MHSTLKSLRDSALAFSLVLAADFSAAQTAIPSAPPIAAASYVLIDLTTGATLATSDPTLAREPASLTKLMTGYVVFQALKQKQITLTQTVPVSTKAWKAEGSRMFIEPNKPVTVEELLRGMIIQSGNDASIALAEAVAGTEEAFVIRMNNETKRLGMAQTLFGNSAGLPAPNHTTTAKDMAILAAALIRDFPEYYALYKEKTFTYNKITQENRNRLLFVDPSVDGVKTGHTQSAGYNLIASAQRNGRRLLSVVMGTASEGARATESKKLLEYGYGSFDAVVIKRKGDVISAPQVWKGDVDIVNLSIADDWLISLPRGSTPPTIEAKLTNSQLVAPLAAGARVGTITAKSGNTVIGERPLVVAQAVAEGSFFKRIWHSLKMQWGK
jgi:serine-type D-Ala-D-Ala carboxypeptidase (penicillin-binding protein 5/6)